ncbi:hypothetical protein MRB53_028401 [Persea americana]|uniref:Uncharacterized protein n=1 Tax=Persea americana TaxID=3435 RepID=A0ACC2KFE2_PERAE|nr:hypothetical protein MRB53_028401 [Persea americana]
MHTPTHQVTDIEHDYKHFSSSPRPSSYTSTPSGIQGQPLEVTVVGCTNLKKTEWISRQDPYVCVEYANTKFRTRTCTDGHKNPTFQDKFVFSLIEGLQELSVNVWSSNTLSNDDFIGSGRVQLQKVLSQGYDDTAWTLQSKSGRFAGEVRLLLHYANLNSVKSGGHFVLEENMQEVDCPCVTPEVVLKASGHVHKFTDPMVKDEKTGTCYLADLLLKDFCKEKLEKDLSLTAEKAAELKHVLAILDDLSSEQLGAKLKEYGINASDTKNPLSDPYPFNLMFQTSIGPSGLSPGYMRPETAQGIFVNFKDLYYYNGNKLPFAAAQIGQAVRNEFGGEAKS